MSETSINTSNLLTVKSCFGCRVDSTATESKIRSLRADIHDCPGLSSAKMRHERVCDVDNAEKVCVELGLDFLRSGAELIKSTRVDKGGKSYVFSSIAPPRSHPALFTRIST